ncbi:MAG: 16S rRNA (cytosine(967)-C(5))-methyltransferase RsmB [Clostridia bacterium]|nr:16S rRNA (cytosine(967)-C(5))-methyltransferase RsmB [Clostridia bacterium]
METARSLAVETLKKAKLDGAFSTLSLSAALGRSALSAADKALASNLVYGVTARRLTLEYELSLYLAKPLSKLHPTVEASLLVGAYQLLFTDKIPVSAAVNESVKLVKAEGCAYAAGLVNAVLRKVAAAGLVLPDAKDKIQFLSIKYSCPPALISHFRRCYGEEAAVGILEASLVPRPIFVRVNTCKTDAQTLIERLSSEGVAASPCDLPGALRLDRPGDLTKLGSFQEGLFHVQDLSSQRTVSLIGLKPGDVFADLCAAPGGKAFTAAEILQNGSCVYACDIYEHKCALIRSGAERLGLTNVTPVLGDARNAAGHIPSADAVLCDVPCSGLGVIGRKPEIRYKDLSALSELPPLQYEILSAGAEIVRPGGTLVYSTCTLNPAENEEVCARFLREHPGFRLADDESYRAACTGDYMTVLPSPDGGDGFFAAKFKREDA